MRQPPFKIGQWVTIKEGYNTMTPGGSYPLGLQGRIVSFNTHDEGTAQQIVQLDIRLTIRGKPQELLKNKTARERARYGTYRMRLRHL